MKLSQLAAISAMVASAFGASVTKRDDDPEIKVDFYKFPNEKCEDPGNHEEIEHGECQNFDHKFKSFYYLPHDDGWGNDNDFQDTRCSIVVYEKKDCEGASYCMGSFPLTRGSCGKLGDGWAAYSAKVRCDDSCSKADFTAEEVFMKM